MNTTLPRRTLNAEENLLHQVRTNVQHLCALSLEVITFPHIDSNRIVAEPQKDQIYGVTFTYHNDVCNWKQTVAVSADHEGAIHFGGILLKQFMERGNHLLFSQIPGKFIFVQTEKELFEEISSYILR